MKLWLKASPTTLMMQLTPKTVDSIFCLYCDSSHVWKVLSRASRDVVAQTRKILQRYQLPPETHLEECLRAALSLIAVPAKPEEAKAAAKQEATNPSVVKPVANQVAPGDEMILRVTHHSLFCRSGNGVTSAFSAPSQNYSEQVEHIW